MKYVYNRTLMTPFSTVFELILFVSLIVLWSVSELIVGGILPKLRRSGETAKRHKFDSSAVLRVSIYVSVIIAIMLAGNNIAMLPHWLFYPGILLMVLGILVRLWAIVVLGRFFTFTICVQQNQKVVDYGPYRFIRHPSYLGMLVTVIGIGVALQSWGGILVIVVLFGLAIGYRMHIEEKFLVSELGDEYLQYMRRTKRLIPFVV